VDILDELSELPEKSLTLSGYLIFSLLAFEVIHEQFLILEDVLFHEHAFFDGIGLDLGFFVDYYFVVGFIGFWSWLRALQLVHLVFIDVTHLDVVVEVILTHSL